MCNNMGPENILYIGKRYNYAESFDRVKMKISVPTVWQKTLTQGSEVDIIQETITKIRNNRDFD